MKTIAIWAPLRYANYGDDLQALAFGQMIKNMGYSVKLYQLEESLANAYGMQSVNTINELCEGVNLCIIAGGALLTPFSRVKRLLHKAAIEYEHDFKELLSATYKFPQIKFCAISIGGDGLMREPSKWYSRARINFFKSDAFIDGTVRLAGDANVMKQFGKNFIYYPDMLFCTPKYFGYDKLENTRKFRVGINFKKGKYLDKKLLSDIYKYAENNDDVEFHFTTTHMQKVGLNYQYIPEKESRNIFIDCYKSPSQLLGVLASMDLFITSMLHLGLTGLSVRTPFISYRGPSKTKSFLKSIGGEWAIVDDHISFEDLRKNYFSKTRKELYNQYDRNIIEDMEAQSVKQYEFCKMTVENFA